MNLFFNAMLGVLHLSKVDRFMHICVSQAPILIRNLDSRSWEKPIGTKTGRIWDRSYCVRRIMFNDKLIQYGRLNVSFHSPSTLVTIANQPNKESGRSELRILGNEKARHFHP